MAELKSISLSVILVHYFTPELLNNCISSVYKETKEITFEIIIVNNGSKPGFAENLLHLFPEVKIIEAGYNAGFARANNIGMRSAKGENILLLNSDTIIINYALDRCVHEFENDSAIACGVQLLNKDYTHQISGSYFIKGGLNFLLPLPYLGRIIRAVAFGVKAKVPHMKSFESRVEVDWINGAYLMIKKSVIAEAGLMDEDFFLYAEETEWCSRIKQKGKLVIYGDINVIHLEGGSSNDLFGAHAKGYYSLYDKRGFQLMVSNLLRIRKQFGVLWFLFMLSFYVFEIPVFILGNFLTLPFNMKHFSLWISSPFLYMKNILRLLSISPRIILNRPYFYKMI